MRVSRAGLRWRDLAVDAGLALAVFFVTVDQGTGSELELTGEASVGTRTLFATAMAVLVLLRRVNPYPLLALSAAAWAVMSAPWGLIVAGYTISRQPRHPRWYPALVGALVALVYARLLFSEVTPLFAVLVTVLIVAVPALLGLWVGDRRALIDNLREKAQRLQREQHLEAEQATARERARIAREMHDVVAHRVGLMVLHAGALEVTLTDEAAAQKAGLIRQTGREALEELRHVLGLLRDPAGGVPLDPQPTLADLDRVVEQSRDAGLEVSMAIAGERRPLPETVERTAYRVVQEALTNVHKHAEGAATEVGLRYTPARLDVTVCNAGPGRGTPPNTAVDGGGHGLLGLRERVALLDGTFHAGPGDDGGFEVRASLPTGVPA